MRAPTRIPPEVTVVVMSHLRWDAVCRRPQHIVSRLARERRVLFVEEPTRSEGEATGWEREQRGPTLTVLRPRVPVPSRGFGGVQTATLTSMVRALVTKEPVGPCIAWLYTPMALPLALALQPKAIVYDCMEEPTALVDPAPELLEREAELLARADLVFTAGRSLHRAKRTHGANVHCFPNSVDAAHFGKVRHRPGDPPDQLEMPHPRLGFSGVIDERVDPSIVEALAGSHPDWQIVLLGPVVNVDPEILPRARNVHCLGTRPYAELPAYVAGWDVCLLPFALNAATRFASPAQTLEYMAAGRPIVSTPIPDVADRYAAVVHLGSGPAGFVAACERVLRQTDGERDRRQAGANAILTHTSWDRTVAAMERLVAPLVADGGRAAGGASP